MRDGMTTEERDRIKAPERENRELRQANESLRKASAYFAHIPLMHVNMHCPAMDNALAETINGLYKTELVHKQAPWRNMQTLELATLGWVDWFNNRRLLGPIGNIPPAEAEHNYYAQRDVLNMVA